MKIVYLLTYLDSQTGGMERQALQLAKKLRERGQEIFFITCAHLGRMRQDSLQTIDLKEGFRVYRIPLFSGMRHLNMVLYGIGALILLVLTWRRYQIIHAHQLYTSGLLASFAKLILPSKKVIIKNAAGGNKCGDVAELKRLQGSRFFIALMRRMVDQFIAVSPQTAEEMQAVGFTRLTLIPNGVDANHFCPLDHDARNKLRQKMLGSQADQNIILFVGRLGSEKNLFTLFDAIHLLNANVHLYLIGNGVLSNQLRNYAKEQGIAERVHFLGQWDSVQSWYQIADVFVLPSHSEGSPNTLLEAMSSGVPSIGSDIPAIQYILKNNENGCLFPKDNPKELAVRLRNIFDDEELRHRLSANGRLTIKQHFSLDTIAQQYVGLYNALLP